LPAKTSIFGHAVFHTAVHRIEDLPPDRGAEIAFAGRSNSGKSSAINALTNRKRLAYVSKLPGRTQAINFFALGAHRYLVDLPGYGYAAVSKRERQAWATLIGAYLQTRNSLRGLILIMDIRNALTNLDRQLLAWVAALGKPAHALLTKSDKLTRSQAAATLRRVEGELVRDFPGGTVQLFSSTRGTGWELARSVAAGWLQ
jgi:GTP-binding protein